MSHSVVLEHTLSSAGSLQENTKLKRQRVYIFLTRQGLLYSVLLFIVLLGAINYTNSMAYILTFTMGSLFVTGILHTYRNLRGLILKISNAKSVFPGDTALFPLLIDNRDGNLRVGIDIAHQPRKGWKQFKTTPLRCVDIDPGKLITIPLEVPAKNRGYLKINRLRISTTYPLGLFRAWSYVDSECFCLVYPESGGDSRLPIADDDYSETQTGTRSGTDDFTGFRPYRPGDSIRNIDWKILAREQGLMVKRFSGSGTRKLVLNWDLTAHLNDIEKRLSQLCLWVLEAEKNVVAYGLITPYSKLDVNQGEQHRAECLSALATHGLD